jgi:hypothetical protein
MKFPSLSLAIPLLLTPLVGAPAGASRRVAVLAPEARGSGAAKLSRATLAKLLRLLSSDDLEAISPGRKRSALLKRCGPGRRAACQRAARPLRADLVLISRLVKRGKQVTATIQLLSVERAVLTASTVVREHAARAPGRIAEAAQGLLVARLPAKTVREGAPAPSVPVATAVKAQASDDEDATGGKPPPRLR